jgi:hypothetical protein
MAFKRHVSAAAGTQFILNAQYSTVFPLSDEKHVHLMEQCCSVSVLEVKDMSYS